MIDGNMFNDKHGNDDDILVDGIRAGYHSIKIYRLSKGYRKNWDNNKNLQLVYDANVYIKPQYHVDITINRFGKAFLDEQQMTRGYYDDHDNNNGGWNSNNNHPMNARSFELFKQTITNGVYDATKLNIAKQGIAANYFSSAQAKEIVQLFSYDNSKLEIAKYAYKYTTDKSNYFTVVDALTYSGSKEDLTKYIQQNP